MARIRTIKPEFPQSESMGRVSRDARLLFIMIWTIADDSGRLRGSSRMLASLLFPYDEDAPELIDTWLNELDNEGCIVRYSHHGGTYLQVCNWLSHQKIDKPSASKIPAFVESSRIFSNPRERSSEDLGSRTLDQELDQENSAADRGIRPVEKSGDNGDNFSTGDDDLFADSRTGLNLNEDPPPFSPPDGTNLTEKQFAELVHESGGTANAIEVARFYADVIKPGYDLHYASDYAGIRKFALEIYRRKLGLNSDQKIRASKAARGAPEFDLSPEDEAIVEKMLTEIKTWPTLRKGSGTRRNGNESATANGRAS